jgi:flavin reductase (DIM6/NTAB) family NADH-FMN oxidoreductase RutF
MNERYLRETLGQFPTGVMVLTAELADGGLIGMTMSSFNSVSLDPALVLFSISRTAPSFDVWMECRKFAVNVLGEHQEHMSDRFGRRHGRKWDGLSPLKGRTGVPLLPETIAAFECEPYAHYDGGDHVIMVARIVELHRALPKTGPLLFYDGKYARVENEVRSAR